MTRSHRLPAVTAAIVLAALLTPVRAQGPGVTWRAVLAQPDSFYGTPEARRIAEAVSRYQRPSGGWPKDLDMTRVPADASPPERPDATIDNGATTTQIRLLARVSAAPATPAAAARGFEDAATRGIDYLLQAQYPNGGWPQFYPLRRDYSRHITFNDDAMINVMTLLDEIAHGAPGFAFAGEARKERAAAAVARGIAVLLASQITVGGTLTAWCAQHDEVTLEPRPARSYEPVALSASESVGIVRFLMRQPASPAIVRAVDAAAAWLRRVRLPDGRWARFYELETNRPVFSGRDGVIRYRIEEIEKERQDGYAWLGSWPRNFIDKDYPDWKRDLRSRF